MSICAPAWHDGNEVPASFFVLPAEPTDSVARPTHHAFYGVPIRSDVRFACCNEHLPSAVADVMLRSGCRLVVVRKEGA